MINSTFYQQIMYLVKTFSLHTKLSIHFYSLCRKLILEYFSHICNIVAIYDNFCKLCNFLALKCNLHNLGEFHLYSSNHILCCWIPDICKSRLSDSYWIPYCITVNPWDNCCRLCSRYLWWIIIFQYETLWHFKIYYHFFVHLNIKTFLNDISTFEQAIV